MSGDNMKVDLSGKVAIVTGAGQGIGKSIALELARAKAKVVVSDILMEGCVKVIEEIENLGGEGLAVKCDVSNRKEVDAMIDDTVKAFERIDILVNNAGIYPFRPFSEIREDDWDRVIDVNLKGVFLCCQAVLRVMPDGGKIVNIGSAASLTGWPSLVHYCASKGGVDGFTRALALELAPRGINVNTVAPGQTETAGTGEIGTKTISTIPLKRAGHPDDIAYLTVFLASDYAKNITMQVFASDGGLSLRREI
jgi:NAD(P)-dependent dehydrogenase (short-subunit alcohol dehydrogenase family)